ncbi:hypothetical protein RQP46_010604 [Phenoliferia psychrophenolica]
MPGVDFSLGPGNAPTEANLLLPPLTDLIITRSSGLTTWDLRNLLGDTLETLQPSLRRLAIEVRGDDWATPLVPFLGTLETFELITRHCPITAMESQINAIAPALSQSTSLRHLIITPRFGAAYLPETLLASLPTSLESLRLGRIHISFNEFTEHFERMLVALKQSTPRPLRVTVTSAWARSLLKSRTKNILACVEEFRMEDIDLVFD